MDYPQVYDVTPFMDDHPGGDEVLLSATGKYNLSNAPIIVIKLSKVGLLKLFAHYRERCNQ